MIDVAALIADLVAAGTPAALVGRVASALATPSQDDEASADRRERDRIRKRISRDKSKSVSTDSPRTVTRTEPAPSPPPSLPPKEIPQTPLEITLFHDPSPQPRVSRPGEFARFWDMFPNKVGKADAFKAFDRAIKRVELETMMAGLDLYAHKTDDRPWCNPATWLNQDRWADQPARASPRASPRPATGLNAITEKFRQELAEDGYSNQGQEGRDPQADARLPLLAISDHRGGR